jgi:phospholipid-binding lipoprotein MlaA
MMAKRLMTPFTLSNLIHLVTKPSLLACATVLFLSACAQKPAPSGITDPLEANNREVHAFNLAVDRALLRPTAQGYGKAPSPIRQGISNFANNLDMPSDVVNGLLQARPHNAAQNTLRFVVNTTVGIGGLFDPATALGLPAKTTDFGETLHVWGASEGNYVEVPFLGPSTERDLAGKVVDFGLNPLRYILPSPEGNIATVAAAASSLGDRHRYSDTIDSVLYESADSYAQARLLYLQNRRFELGQTTGAAADDAFEDPYEDLYGN